MSTDVHYTFCMDDSEKSKDCLMMVSFILLLPFFSSSCLPFSSSPPSQGGKAAPKKRAAPVERGTTKNKRSQVDESWLPEGTIPSNSFISLLILIQSSSEHYICSV